MATVYRDANRQRPDLSTIARPPAKKMPGREISNINELLRQNQQQELRVNTSEDLAVLSSWQQKPSACSHSRQSSCIF
jgi:hypothetical protein